VPANPHFDFGPYAQILKTLLPRSRGIYLYAPDGDLLWSSDGADFHDLRPAVEELLESAKQNASASGLRRMLDDAPAYCFLLRDELGAVLGVTAVVCRAVTRDADLPTFESVERTLAPLMVLTRRDLGQQRVIETGRFQIGDTAQGAGFGGNNSVRHRRDVSCAPCALNPGKPSPTVLASCGAAFC